MTRSKRCGVLIVNGLLSLSCSGTNGSSEPIGVGGLTGSGGNDPTGGRVSTGGTSSMSGGSRAQGGATFTGGSNGTGGSSTRGGASSGGSATSTGGTSRAGSSTTGGAVTGGSAAKGGATNTGGTATGGRATGGVAPTGGVTATGGVMVTGGSLSMGGATGGSSAKGGNTSTGGAISTGGTTGTGGGTSTIDPKRYRIMWSSDFPPIPVTNSDPDDVQTVIRLVLYSNELEVEGFIASAGTYGMVANKSNFDTIWNAYDKVYPNLQKHDSKYPTPAAMRAMTYEGKGNNNGVSIKWECNQQPATNLIGTGKESEASKAIIAAVDKPDPRPLWIGVAGGPREVAQAIWTVRNTRSDADAKAFISKLRVFLIHCQDSTDQYIMSVPGLFVIDSKTSYASFCCGNDALCNSTWTNTNIRTGHGPLGEIYPERGVCSAGVAEGDSPAFMHLVSAMRNINNPEVPSEPSWGGQYKLSSDNKWTDGGGGKIVSGRATYQPEFAQRANWMVQ